MQESFNEKQQAWLHRQVIVFKVVYVIFHLNFALYIVVYRCNKPCEFLGFVWTGYWGKLSNYMYVITSLVNYVTLYVPPVIQWM